MNEVNALNDNEYWGTEKTLEEDETKIKIFVPEELRLILPKVNAIDPKGRLIMGAYPADIDSFVSKEKVEALIKGLGVKTFLCLQPNDELEDLKSYRATARKISKEVEFLHFPIVDVGTASDSELIKYLKETLIPKIQDGSCLPLYIHCMGGNGRSGTVAALLLSYFYQLSSKVALANIDKYHGFRLTPVFSAPETEEQCNQVHRIAKLLTV